MSMIGMMSMPSCMGLYVDFDLLYLSELDPLWSSDILNLTLNPEAIIFSTPATYAWCAADCIMTTADNQIEEFYGCAACDGSLYPMTGKVAANNDPVASSSLITQRVLAGLHRKGLAQKTIGDAAMCDPEYFPTVPRSQYKFSMLAPSPESSSSASKAIVAPFIGDTSDAEDQKANDMANNAGSAGDPVQVFESCCHPMGMSTSRWCLPVGGRNPPGKDTAYVYLIWNYRNCCLRDVST
jgi:conjugal transfer pilus assembly protein TraU